MRPQPFLIIFLLGGQFICAFGRTTHPTQTGTPNARKELPHKVVQVDWRAQLAATQKKLEREPNSAFLHSQAAVAYDALGDFESFDREIQTAIRLDSGDPMYCYMAYAVYKRRHVRDKQTTVLDTAVKIDSANPLGHYEKAGMLEDDKGWQSALKEYETVQRLLQRVKSEPNNFQNNGWRYVDARGNPYDLTPEESHIAEDIARVRAAMRDQR